MSKKRNKGSDKKGQGKKGKGKKQGKKGQLTAARSVTLTMPQAIVLFRHNNKPADGSDPNLTQQGQERSEELGKWLPGELQAWFPGSNGKPDFIIAAADSNASDRPVETVEPLSQDTGVPIEQALPDKKFAELAADLFTDPQYADKIVVVCWHHGEIPQLMAALHAPSGSYPDPWDPTVFNLILRLDYTTGNLVPVVTQITEPF